MKARRIAAALSYRLWISISLLLLLTPNAFAGMGGGTVQIAHVYPGNLVFLYTSQRSNAPACTVTTTKRWVLDISTVEGRAKYSLLLSAQLMGKAVVVAGTGGCALWGDSETVDWVGFPVDPAQIP